MEEDKRLKLPTNWEAKKARFEYELMVDEKKKVQLYKNSTITSFSATLDDLVFTIYNFFAINHPQLFVQCFFFTCSSVYCIVSVKLVSMTTV